MFSQSVYSVVEYLLLQLVRWLVGFENVPENCAFRKLPPAKAYPVT